MNENGPDFGAESPLNSGVVKPKSNKKLWIFGCLGLIGLVCVGIVASVFIAAPVLALINENVAQIEVNPKVVDAVGTPVSVGDPTTSRDPNTPGGIVARGSVSGPNGNGTYVIQASLEDGEMVRKAIYLEIDGQEIDLDPEALFDIEVDTGF